MADKVQSTLVTGEPVPESDVDRALLGQPSLVTLKPDTEGERTKVRILRDCGDWTEGDEPAVNAEYARQLVENGLAEQIATKSKAPLPALQR